MRIGQSQDIHKLVENRKLIIGGVEIPFEKGLLGHSDADVLLHAICEAIIGAMSLGDIGKHFPDNDPKYKDISSLVLLENVYELMKENHYHLVNLDSLILIEKPKMAPYINQMIDNISKALHCDSNIINVKATRGEALGFVGRGEGVIAQCVVLIEED